MATFEYVDLPADAVRLKPTSLVPATKIVTGLPAEVPPSRPLAEALSPLALVPQMFLAAAPTVTAASLPVSARLSTRDPLSVPIMTANFRRFISKIGPLFWLQDRIEEVVLWKKGWKRTTVCIAAYGFFCYFPRMALLIPHLLLLWVMLSYPTIGQGAADWQANVQAIQNLMGAVSDVHDAVVPLLPLLVVPSSSHHPLLIATLLSFLIFLPLLITDLLPLRLLFFLTGAGTVGALHPRIRGSLSNILTALSGSGPGLSFHFSFVPPRLPSLLHPVRSSAPPRTYTFTLTLTPRDAYLFFRRLIDDDRLDDTIWRAPLAHVELWENERWIQDPTEHKRRKSVAPFVREGEDDGKDDDTASISSTATVTDAGNPGTWSKANLRPTERVGWTRGRDGWCGVGGEVSSNLTFSLSSGWTFVKTEGWRPDLSASWAVEGALPCTSVCVGADEDGWTYTTDTWTHPRPDGRPTDGWVTRRRRWVRRVYFQGVEQ